MTIRLRILALLSLLSIFCVGSAFFFNQVQEREESFGKKEQVRDLTVRLQRLVGSTSRSAYRYLRNYSGRGAMVEFLDTRDPEWAEKYLKGKMDLYRFDSVWVMKADGTVVYGLDQPTERVLTTPPLAVDELLVLFRKNEQFSFFAFLGDRLYQFQGMPIVATADLDRRTPPLGWLMVAKHWGKPVLEDMADVGQGRVSLTTATPPPEAGPAQHELAAWVPLTDHLGRTIAGLDFRVKEPELEDPVLENIELALFFLNGVGAILLVALLMHYWILRPFSLVRASLVASDEKLLAPLLHQSNEFGQMARIVQSSMRDREQLQHALEERLRLGRELHDGAIQGVYGAGMALSRVQALMVRDLPAAGQLLDDTRAELNRIIRDLRLQIEKADPKPLDTSFSEAVARLIQQLDGSGLVAKELDIDEALVAGYPSLDRSQALLFAREAISNALRHGRPSRLAVSWQRTPEGSMLSISDNGLGFDPGKVRPGGRGLGNLSERALSLGGRLAVESSPHQGTRVNLKLPPSKTPA